MPVRLILLALALSVLVPLPAEARGGSARGGFHAFAHPRPFRHVQPGVPPFRPFPGFTTARGAPAGPPMGGVPPGGLPPHAPISFTRQVTPFGVTVVRGVPSFGVSPIGLFTPGGVIVPSLVQFPTAGFPQYPSSSFTVQAMPFGTKVVRGSFTTFP